jgi:DNA-directed RNA polymerase II subunit RPB1
VRLNAVHNITKSKSICETGEDAPQEGEDVAGEPTGQKKGHGGCGNYQPKITRDGLKLTAEFKQVNDETIEKKQNLTAEKVAVIGLIWAFIYSDQRRF